MLSKRPSRHALMTRLALAGAFCLVWAATAAAAVYSKVEGESLIAARPLEPSSYEIYAQFLTGQGALEEAIEILEKGRVKAPPSSQLLVSLSLAYEAVDQIAKAEAVTRDALNIDPDNPRAHMRMGDLFFQLGWPKSGLDSYQTAVTLAPDDPAPKVKLVAGYLEIGQSAQAEEYCLRFIAENPETPDLWLSLGQVFEKQGKRREAFTTYGQVLTIDSSNAVAYARQGRLFCEFGQFTSAEAACRRALELDPDSSLGHAYLGIALSYLGNSEEARKHAQIAEKAGLNMVSVWKKIGQ